MSNRSEKKVVVVGSGPAGLAAAIEAKRYTANITLLASERIGGNAVLHSLIPSKSLIEAASHLQYLATVASAPGCIDLNRVMQLQARQIAALSDFSAPSLEGIQVIPETAVLTRQGESIAISTDQGRAVPADVIIIAAGSKQRLIEGAKPDGRRILMPRIFQTLQAIPKSLAVIGAGATGLEAAALFSLWGAEVTLYFPHATAAPQYSNNINTLLARQLSQYGIVLQAEHRIVHVDSAPADGPVAVHWVNTQTLEEGDAPHAAILLAAGRESTWPQGWLESLGFIGNAQGFFSTGPVGETNIDGVYAVGDAGGPPMTASKAIWQGKAAIHHAFGEPLAYIPTPIETIYTLPELSRFGPSQLPQTEVWEADYHNPLFYRPVLMQADEGLLRVYTHEERILGAEAFGPHAGDVASYLALAQSLGMSVSELSMQPISSPSMLEWVHFLHKVS